MLHSVNNNFIDPSIPISPPLPCGVWKIIFEKLPLPNIQIASEVSKTWNSYIHSVRIQAEKEAQIADFKNLLNDMRTNFLPYLFTPISKFIEDLEKNASTLNELLQIHEKFKDLVSDLMNEELQTKSSISC